MKWILTLLVVGNLTQAFAWGPEGHMIVAEIAEQRLTPKALSSVKKLLPNNSLAEIANWADVIKNKPEWQKTKSWHFVNIPDGGSYETSPHSADGDAIAAVTNMVAVLSNKTSSQLEKENALKFLVHFMGDLHQPLHVGREEDQGGNTIKVQFEGFNTNLHQLWDSGMITQQKMDFQAYANYLLTHGTDQNNPSSGIPFKQIVSEDMAVRSMIYNFSNLVDSSIRLDRTYMNRNLATLNKQLLNGGIRLGDLLNSLFK